MGAYPQLKDGEGLDLRSGELWKLACCDCGLVHDVVIVAKGKAIGFALRRNKRATAQKRRHMNLPTGLPRRTAVSAPA
jgi:hypothetical protein